MVGIAGASIQVRAFFVLGLAVVLAIVATWILERTRTGRGLQAIASDQEGAHVVGIPVERLVAGAFGAVGGLAAIAAIASAPSAPFDVDTGTLLGLKGLVAAVVVRFASPWRAFAAGLALGLVGGGDRERRHLRISPRARIPRGAADRGRPDRRRAPGPGGASRSSNDRVPSPRLRRAFAGAAQDLRSAWRLPATVAAVGIALAFVVPPLAFGSLTLQDLAGWLYLALAATGLAFALGLAGMPSLCQGAFMAIGAFTAALLRARTGAGPIEAALAGLALTTLAGVGLGVGFVRLGRVPFAVATWLFAWLVALGLAAFPSIGGGADGIAIADSGLGDTGHYVLALALVVLACLAFFAIARGAPGLALSALRQRRAAALAPGRQGDAPSPRRIRRLGRPGRARRLARRPAPGDRRPGRLRPVPVVQAARRGADRRDDRRARRRGRTGGAERADAALALDRRASKACPRRASTRCCSRSSSSSCSASAARESCRGCAALLKLTVCEHASAGALDTHGADADGATMNGGRRPEALRRGRRARRPRARGAARCDRRPDRAERVGEDDRASHLLRHAHAGRRPARARRPRAERRRDGGTGRARSRPYACSGRRYSRR